MKERARQQLATSPAHKTDLLTPSLPAFARLYLPSPPHLLHRPPPPLVPVLDRDADARLWLQSLFPPLFRYHDYLHGNRGDPDTGLVYLHHPWEAEVSPDSALWPPLLRETRYVGQGVMILGAVTVCCSLARLLPPWLLVCTCGASWANLCPRSCDAYVVVFVGAYDNPCLCFLPPLLPAPLCRRVACPSIPPRPLRSPRTLRA